MRLSGHPTMWNAWIGFNFSRSLGLISFGLVYGYFATCRWGVLHNSVVLVVLGCLVLLTYVVLSLVYWFTGPFVLVSCEAVLYFAGVACRIARS